MFLIYPINSASSNVKCFSTAGFVEILLVAANFALKTSGNFVIGLGQDDLYTLNKFSHKLNMTDRATRQIKEAGHILDEGWRSIRQLYTEPHVRPISCHVTSLPWQELQEESNNFF